LVDISVEQLLICDAKKNTQNLVQLIFPPKRKKWRNSRKFFFGGISSEGNVCGHTPKVGHHHKSSFLFDPTTMDILTIPDGATHLLIINCKSNADAITIRNHINGKTFVLDDDTPLKWTHLQDNTYFTTSRLADNFIKSDTQTILRKPQVSFSCIIQRILLRSTIGKVQE